MFEEEAWHTFPKCQGGLLFPPYYHLLHFKVLETQPKFVQTQSTTPEVHLNSIKTPLFPFQISPHAPILLSCYQVLDMVSDSEIQTKGRSNIDSDERRISWVVYHMNVYVRTKTQWRLGFVTRLDRIQIETPNFI